MRKFKLSALKLFVAFAVITPCLTPVTALAEALPEGVKQVWTSVEGNVIYYVKEGDKVKEDTPLFFILNSENDPGFFWKIQHEVEYYRKLYLRRKKLIKSHAVSQEALDTALQNLVNAEDQLLTYIAKVSQAFYTAPFDCEITKLLYLQKSGIGDGNPAINIKCTDKNYKFEPPKCPEKLTEVLKQSKKIISSRIKELDVDNLTL